MDQFKHKCWQKMAWASIWVIFSQTHLVSRLLESMLWSQFSPSFANFPRKNWRFLKNQRYAKIFEKTSSSLRKNANFSPLKKCFLNHYIGPWSCSVVLRILNLQLRRRRCGRLQRFQSRIKYICFQNEVGCPRRCKNLQRWRCKSKSQDRPVIKFLRRPPATLPCEVDPWSRRSCAAAAASDWPWERKTSVSSGDRPTPGTGSTKRLRIYKFTSAPNARTGDPWL
jgi:hypothetical protein